MTDESTHNPSASASSSQTPGQILQAARERRGTDRSAIAARLRVSVQTIIDIENDQYQNFPAEVYARGHLRAYSKLMDVNPEIVMSSFNQLVEEFIREPDISTVSLSPGATLAKQSVFRGRMDKRKKILWLASGLLLVLLALLGFWAKDQKRVATMHAETKSNVTAAAPAAVTDRPAVAEESTSVPEQAKPELKSSQASKSARAVAEQTHSVKLSTKTTEKSSDKGDFVPDYSIETVKN